MKGLALIIIGSIFCMPGLWILGVPLICWGCWLVNLPVSSDTPIGDVEQELHGVEEEE